MRDFYLCRLLLVILILPFFAGCGETFLDLKPNQRERVPNRLEDYLAVLNYTTILNQTSVHALAYFATDEFYMPDSRLAIFPTGMNNDYMMNAYLWNSTVYSGGETGAIDWHMGFRSINFANVVLDGLVSLDRLESPELFDQVKGMALFYRAYNYFKLTQLYCDAFNVNATDDILGLPLRLSSDPTLLVPRSSLKETYALIISDLSEAEILLPSKSANHYNPDKIAAHALFARIYLNMEDYAKAEDHADLALSAAPGLLNFNSLSFSNNYTFPRYGEGNPEIIFMSSLVNFPNFSPAGMNIDSNLLDLYNLGDLRKKAFFKVESTGEYTFRGSYHGDHLYFTGLTAGELHLISAESKLRLGKINQALDELNELRRHRYRPDSFVQYESNSEQEVLDWIIDERRKELVLRGQRWSDLRRLNKDPRYATTLKRVALGKEYTLPPGDRRWTWPLPEEAVRIGKLIQNPR